MLIFSPPLHLLPLYLEKEILVLLPSLLFHISICSFQRYVLFHFLLLFTFPSLSPPARPYALIPRSFIHISFHVSLLTTFRLCLPPLFLSISHSFLSFPIQISFPLVPLPLSRLSLLPPAHPNHNSFWPFPLPSSSRFRSRYQFTSTIKNLLLSLLPLFSWLAVG